MYLLISKHKALEADVQAHEPQLMSVAAVGDELISQGHFGADRIQVIYTKLLRKSHGQLTNIYLLFRFKNPYNLW